jgi:hypothetical protein
LLLALTLIGCAPAAKFRIRDDQIITKNFVGFGGEMNPYLYARPNWAEPTYAASQPAQGAVNERKVADLERKVTELSPRHVRIFMLLHWWTPSGDYEIAKGDPRMIDSFIRTVRLAQRAGATVNLTLWYGPHPDPDASGRKFAQIVTKLIRDEGLMCIRYLTIQNEPNDSPKLKFANYVKLYRALDDELRKLEMRDQLQIVSGDLVSENQEKWFHDIAENLSDISDGYSIHAYWNYWNPKWLVERLTSARRIVDSLPLKSRRPLFVTEFGVRGNRPRDEVEPGWFADGTPVADDPRQAVQIAWFDLLALNLGYVATVQWELYDAWYDRLMPYGVIGDATTGFKLKPAYYVMRLLTHTIKPGWQIIRVDGSDADVIVAAARNDSDEMTIVALNRSSGSRRVNIAGITLRRSLTVLRWNRLAVREEGSFNSPTIELTLRPQSLYAFTTSDWRPNQ